MLAILKSKPTRKRNINVKYTDEDYIPYFDIDKKDFEQIVLKLNRNEQLTKDENRRYGEYVLAVTECILEGPRFRFKPENEKEDLRDWIYFEILNVVPPHYKEPRGTIYNYCYRCGYLKATHYYTDAVKESQKQQKYMQQLANYATMRSVEANDIGGLHYEN